MHRKHNPAWLFTFLAVLVLATMAVVVPFGKDTHELAPAFKPGLLSSGKKQPPLLELVNFLPLNAVRDGSVDYTVFVQAALDAADGRTLRLAPFPVRVSKRPNSKICLTARHSMSIEGSPGSMLVDPDGASMILYCDDIDGLRLSNFTLRGKAAPGVGLAHGILQVTGGSDIVIEGVNAENSDADGIVVANASDVRVDHCRAVKASKVGIYLSNCSRATVTGNVVSGITGHTTPDGRVCGAGMQLSGNRGLVCSSNVLENGVGIGILCNANTNQPKPDGTVIANNWIRGFHNLANSNVSCGIRLENSNPDTQTRTLVEGNSIDDCGVYGILVENHAGAVVRGNTVRRSERSGIVVSEVQGAWIADNLLEDCDVSNFANQAGIYLLQDANDVKLEGNWVKDTSSAFPPPGFQRVRDLSSGSDSSSEARIEWSNGPPNTGSWTVGDRVFALSPASGYPVGWACTAPGTPGTWRVIGRVE